MSIAKLNWSAGFFRLWLSASILWWLAITATLVSEQGREARAEFLRSQGIECSLESVTLFFGDPVACRSPQGESSTPRLGLRDLLGLTLDRLRSGAHWQRWAYLAWVPVGVLLAGILLRHWVRWIHRGLVPDRGDGPAREQPVGKGLRSRAALRPVGVAPEEPGGATGVVGNRGPGLRANLVRAAQILNELDDELVELDDRLVGSSKDRAQVLRREIPGFGRRLITLVQALDKQGLAPDNLRLFADPVRGQRDPETGSTEAKPRSNPDPSRGNKGFHLASS